MKKILLILVCFLFSSSILNAQKNIALGKATRQLLSMLNIKVIPLFLFLMFVVDASSQSIPLPGFYYQIIAKHSGKVLDVPGASRVDGEAIIQYSSTGNDNQLFRLEDKGGGYFQIIAKHSGKVLDVPGASRVDGEAIIQYSSTGNDNQLFRLEDKGGGYFQIIAKHSEKVLDVRGASRVNGEAIIQYSSTGNDNQLFKFIPAAPVDLECEVKAQNSASWMCDNKEKLGNIPLGELAIPGAHDCGVYKVENTWQRMGEQTFSEKMFEGKDLYAPDTNEAKRGLSWTGEFFARWSRAQDKSIYQQLMGGARYLDIRVCVDKSGNLMTCHSLYGVSIPRLLDEVQRFNEENPNEVVILDFNKFYDWKVKDEQKKGNVSEYYGFRFDKLKELWEEIDDKLEDKIYPYDSNKTLSKLTLNDFWVMEEGVKPLIIVLSMTKDSSDFFDESMYKSDGVTLEEEDSIRNFTSNDYWTRSSVLDPSWKPTNKISRQKKIASMNEWLEEKKNDTDKLKIAAFQITPDGDLIARSHDPFSTYPHGLENLAKQTNPVMLDYLRNEWKDFKPNIIQVDFSNQSCVFAICMELNGIGEKYGDCETTTRTDWGNWQQFYDRALEWLKETGAVNWSRKAGIDAYDWSEQAGSDAYDWTVTAGEDMLDYLRLKKKRTNATPPNNGIPITGFIPKQVFQYDVTLEKIEVLSAGSENDDKLEVYGSISVTPTNVLSNKGANQYLFNKNVHQKITIASGASAHSEISHGKTFYIDEKGLSDASINIDIKLIENDRGENNDDKMFGSILITPELFPSGFIGKRVFTEKVTYGNQNPQEVIVKISVKRTHSDPLEEIADEMTMGRGWSLPQFYDVFSNNVVTTYKFLYNHETGIMNIHVMNSDGSIGEIVQEKEWSTGWTIAEFFVLREIGVFKTYLFLYKKSTGEMKIHEINKDGSYGKVVDDRTFPTGWTSAEFYPHGPIRTSIFLYNARDEKMENYLINSGGTIGELIEEGNLSSGWTTTEIFRVKNKRYLYLMKNGERTAVKIHRLTKGGKVGSLVEEHEWSSGWTAAEFQNIGNAAYLFIMKEGNGIVHIHHMNSDGTIGERMDKKNWPGSGFSNLEVSNISGKPFLLTLKESNGDLKIYPLSN